VNLEQGKTYCRSRTLRVNVTIKLGDEVRNTLELPVRAKVVMEEGRVDGV